MPGAPTCAARTTASPQVELRQFSGWLRAICPSGPAAAARCAKMQSRVTHSRGGLQRRGSQAPLLAVLRGSGGKSPKRRQWRIKRGDFEEAARLAATNSGRESYRRDGGQDFGIPPGFSFGGAGDFLFSKEKTSRRFFAPCQWRNTRPRRGQAMSITSPRRRRHKPSR